MQASVDKARALELLDVEHAAVQALIDELSDEEMTRPNTIEYGLYSGQECAFKDLLAHLLTYEAYAIEAIDAWKRGEKHWISDAMRDPAQSRKVHFEGIDCRRENALSDTLAEWERTKSGLMQAIGALTDAEVLYNFREVAFPEPGSLALLGLGGVMMLRRRSRRAV